MSNCKIEDISMDTFFGAKHLEIVDLSKNELKSIPAGLFDDQHELKEIYLNENQLKELPSDIFKLNSLKMIFLLNNSWDCTCDLKNWRQALTNKIRSKKIENKCAENSLKYNKLSCESSSTQTYTFDHKLSPRCATPPELEGKSVFYALRRVLQCKSEVTSPTTIKSEKRARKLAIKQKYDRHVNRKKIPNKNSLQYQLFHRRNYLNLQHDDNEINSI